MIVVSSQSIVENSRLLKLFESKVEVIPFGYSPKLEFDYPPSSDDYFLAIARHVPYKGLEILLNATVVTKIPIKIAGHGPLLDFHKDLSKSLGISHNVEFIEYPSDEELEVLISRCKALVLPSVSKNEAFGLVQIEAMAYGKPIINTSLKSGVPWVARHMKEAVTVDPWSIEELTDAIILLHNNDSLCSQLSKNALIRWKNIFQEDKFLEDTYKLYKKVMNYR